MSICKDCIHYEICDKYVAPNESFPEVDGCRCFKDKSNFVEFPCKVGRRVYAILSKKVQEYFVHAIEHTEKYITVKCSIWLAEREGLLHKHIAYFDKTKFGKIVFLTREEAEKALKERSENGI